MSLDENRFLRWYWIGVFALYVGCGAYGAAWLSDEFDTMKQVIVGLVGVPLAVGYFALMLMWRKWEIKYPLIHYLWVLSLLLIFSFGNFLMLNATAADPETIEVSVKLDGQVANMQMKRGAFGLHFRERW